MIQKPCFKKIFLICPALLFFLSITTSIADDRGIRVREKTKERIALVIGNGAYKDSPLKNPINDAREMKRTLESLEFEVTKKENIGYQEMNEAIGSFGKKLLKNGGVGLFYYAGHGSQYQGRNYLIPIGANIEHEKQIAYRAIDTGSVLAEMENARNQLNIIILDACRNNPFARNFRSSRGGLAYMDAPSGSIIAYATAPGQTADDGPSSNGLYTSELIREMNIPGQRIIDMFMNVRKGVSEKSGGNQIPWESVSLTEPFYFNPIKNGDIEITEPLQKTFLTVQPDLPDATVWVNEKNMGTGSLRFREIEPGWYQIKVTRHGCEPYEKWVKIEKGESKKITAYLRKIDKKPIIAHLTSEKRMTNSLGMEFVYIPPGSFMMGSPEDELDRDSDERQHQVTLTKGFYMQTTEVTQGQWKAIMRNNPSYFKSCGDNCPVESVSWNDVQEFIKGLNQTERRKRYRLPTEAEWEYACRAGTITPFSFGNCLSSEQANYNGNYPLSGCLKGTYREKTMPVKSFSANTWGLYEMHGNVWEWCQDSYGNYSRRTVINPLCSKSGFYVVRGGSWDSLARGCRSAIRLGRPSSRRDYLIGFRLLLLDVR